MSYAIVYSSRTGNTALLAKTIREILGEEACVYFGPPDAQALAAQTVYAGFWTDRGTCDEEMARFLQSLTDQAVFLYGGIWRCTGLLWSDFGAGAGKFEGVCPLGRDLYVSRADAPGGAYPL